MTDLPLFAFNVLAVIMTLQVSLLSMLYQICILMVQAGRHFNLGDNFLYSYNLCVDLVVILYGEMRCWLLQRAFFNRGGGGGGLPYETDGDARRLA